MQITKFHKKIIVFAVLLLVFGVFFARYDRRAQKRNYGDFHGFYVSGQKFLAGQEIYYKTVPEEGIPTFKHPPSFAFLMGLLSFLNEKNAARLWFAINFVLVLASFYWIYKIISPQALPGSTLFWLFAMGFLLSFRFILHSLDSGQINIVMMASAIFSLYLLDRNRKAAGAVSLGFGSSMKYMPAILWPYLFIKGHARFVIISIFSAIFFVFLPALFIGVEKFMEHFKAWIPFLLSDTLNKGATYTSANQSLLSCLLRFFSGESWFKVELLKLDPALVKSAFVLMAGLIYILILLPAKTKDLFRRNLDYAMLFACMALFNPNAWKHAYIFLLFPYMVISLYLLKNRFRDRFTSFCLVISFILCSLTSEYLTQSWAGDAFEVYSAITIGSLVLLIALLRLKFGRASSI